MATTIKLGRLVAVVAEDLHPEVRPVAAGAWPRVTVETVISSLDRWALQLERHPEPT